MLAYIFMRDTALGHNEIIKIFPSPGQNVHTGASNSCLSTMSLLFHSFIHSFIHNVIHYAELNKPGPSLQLCQNCKIWAAKYLWQAFEEQNTGVKKYNKTFYHFTIKNTGVGERWMGEKLFYVTQPISQCM